MNSPWANGKAAETAIVDELGDLTAEIITLICSKPRTVHNTVLVLVTLISSFLETQIPAQHRQAVTVYLLQQLKEELSL